MSQSATAFYGLGTFTIVFIDPMMNRYLNLEIDKWVYTLF